MSFPFFYVTILTASTSLDLSEIVDLLGGQETVAMGAIISASLVAYALSKLGDLKSIFGYFLILLGLCLVIMVLPMFSGTSAGTYAEETLQILLSLIRGVTVYLRDQVTGLTYFIGGIF